MLSSVNRSISYNLSQNNKSKKTTADTLTVAFQDILTQTSAVVTTKTPDVESYLSQLQSKFGPKIFVQDMEYNKENINRIGSSTAGTGNVIIASNILEKMVTEPQARQYYEKKIQAHFNAIGKARAFMAMHGRRIVSSGVIVHPDGKVTYYSSSDYTPEEKARLEKAMKEEDEAKAEKRKEIKRLNEIALNKHRRLISYSATQVDLLHSEDPGIFPNPIDY